MNRTALGAVLATSSEGCFRTCRRRVRLGVFAALASWLALVPLFFDPASAQNVTGSIQGIVTDAATNKPYPGVTVTARSTTLARTTKTGADGAYALLGLPVDTYTLVFQIPGRAITTVTGVTLQPGAALTQNATIALRTITSVRARAGVGSAFTPAETSNKYSFSQQQITAIQGKDFNSNETNLLRSLPSVTLDKSGTISVRGGFAFQSAYEYENIDYTSPTPNLQNTLQNISNFNLINGVGGVTIIPGGGDASHGNTGTGLIQFQAKRGTYPSLYGFDVEAGAFPYDHQAAIEVGFADRRGRYSNYFSFLGENLNYQYGLGGTPADTLGTRGTNAASLGTLVDPNLVYFSPADQSSRDFVDNAYFRFGNKQTHQLQFFFQGQAIQQNLDYGGYLGLAFPTAGAGVFVPSGNPAIPGPGSTLGLCPSGPTAALQAYTCQNLLPLYPTQAAAYSSLNTPDRLYSPFEAFKFEYQDTSLRDTLIAARVFRTITAGQQELPSQGVLAQGFGGVRSAVATEISHSVEGTSLKQSIEVGGLYEFAQPIGSVTNYADYGAFTDGVNARTDPIAPLFFYNGGTPGRGSVLYDFFTPQGCLVAAVVGSCGYLARYFASPPRLPAIVTAPNVDQQQYGLFVQDAMTIGASDRLHFTPGLRLDGFNFLQPNDPNAPNSIQGVAHQRLYEPHVGLSYLLTKRDALRANFGHTLSIPLPSLLGSPVERSQFAAYDAIPSYDNSTGQPALYCGTNKSTACLNYGDQLYWLARDFVFANQPANVQLEGSTYTNYDASYEHDFGRGMSLKVSPFYRRGFDIVEETADPLGINPRTGAELYTNPIYSNLGLQRTTGLELELERQIPYGLSFLFGATYINQFGNEPPGAILTSQTLAAGTLFHSPDLSPFQSTLALTYQSHGGLRINPVFYFNVGYPYGAGANVTALCNGQPQVVPNTNLTSGQTNAPAYVDPEDPGTCGAPNVAATRGVAEPSGPGGFLSRPQFNADLTIEYSPRAAASTFGLQIRNLFNQLYGTPVFNNCYGAIVSTGVGYGNAPCSYTSVYNAGPASNAYPTGSYNVYPNEQPISAKFYYELKL